MAKTLQDILKCRQQEEFVGRGRQLAFFHHNLRYEPDDDRRRFIINVCGQGDVGADARDGYRLMPHRS